MRKHVGMVFGALIAIVSSSPALAFHCKGSHESDPGCSIPDPVAAPLVVRDGGGAVVGSFFDYDETAFPDLVYALMQLDVEGTPRTFIIEVTEVGFQSTQGGQDLAWSESLDCAEPLFKFPQILLSLEFAFVVDGFAYLSDPAASPENINAQSRQSSDGTCVNGSSAVSGVISTVNVDLDALFSPPYRLGF